MNSLSELFLLLYKIDQSLALMGVMVVELIDLHTFTLTSCQLSKVKDLLCAVYFFMQYLSKSNCPHERCVVAQLAEHLTSDRRVMSSILLAVLVPKIVK